MKANNECCTIENSLAVYEDVVVGEDSSLSIVFFGETGKSSVSTVDFSLFIDNEKYLKECCTI